MFDCFIMNDELDMLEIRLNTLHQFVEKFVLVESDRTHSGKEKEMYFDNNKSRFEKFLSKIIHLKHTAHSVVDGGQAWGNENLQRSTILNALEIAKPTDGLLFISDIDEIPRPERLLEAKCVVCKRGLPVVFNLHYSMYFMNYVSETPSRGAYLYKPEDAKRVHDMFKCERHDPSSFRWHANDVRYINDFPSIDDAGWHFSTMGGVDVIKKKLDSYAHLEFNTPELSSEEHLLKCMKDGVPYYEKLYKFNDRPIRFLKKEMSFLPEYVKFNIDKFRKYILV